MDLWWATWETNGKPFPHLYKKPWRRTSSHQFMTSNLSARQLCSGTMIWNTLVNVHCTLWQEPSFSHTTFRKSFCWQLVHLGYTVVLLQDLTTAFVAGPGFSSTYISKQISLTFHIPLSVQYVSSGWETLASTEGTTFDPAAAAGISVMLILLRWFLKHCKL